MPLLGRISIASVHSVVPFVCPCFYRSFSFCLAFLLPFVWFATAQNDIAPSRLYSIFSSLISLPICVHARKVMKETFPALFAHSLSRLHCWHIASPPSHFIVSLQNTCCYSPCSMIPYSYPSANLRLLPPWACSVCHAQSSPCLRTQRSCAFSYLCRSLPALSRKYICLLGHTAAFASFLLCKGRASVMLQGSQSLLATKKFQRFWGAVAPGPNSLRPED